MDRAWTLSGVLIVLAVLVVACAGSTPTPTPFETAFQSAPECPGFELEREIILRTIPEKLGSGSVYSEQRFRCIDDGFSVGGTVSPGHDYGVSITRYATEKDAKAALDMPNSTFLNSPAVHVVEVRSPGVSESLIWWRSRWVFRAGRFDDTSSMTNVFTASERMHEAAVDLGLFSMATPTPMPTPSPTPFPAAPTPRDSPIKFVLKDRYALGEPIEIRIRNNGSESYLYDLYLNCPTLKFYGADGPGAITANAHCDQISTEEIRPREEAVLWTWHQYQCVAAALDRCYQSCPVKPGRYGIVERFYQEGRERETIAERTFIIVGGDGEDALPAATPGHPPLTPSRDCGESFLGISVNGDALQFDQDRFRVAADTELVLRFKNVSKTNHHNWVLVRAGTKDDVAQRGPSAGPDNDWVQQGDPDVIAHTKLVAPGKTGELRFTSPAAGSYQFVCTFPGHNFSMFGDFVVTP